MERFGRWMGRLGVWSWVIVFPVVVGCHAAHPVAENVEEGADGGGKEATSLPDNATFEEKIVVETPHENPLEKEAKKSWVEPRGGIACDTSAWPSYQGPTPMHGAPLPTDVAEKAKRFEEPLREAVNGAELSKVHDLVCEVRGVLGPWQGIEEISRAHKTPINKQPVDGQELKGIYVQALKGLLGKEQWEKAGGSSSGDALDAPLRQSCEVIEAYLAMRKIDPTNESLYQERAKAGLSYLLKVQASTGIFPFPDLSDEYQALQQSCQGAMGTQAEECRYRLEVHLGRIALKVKQQMQRDGIDTTKFFQHGWFVDDPYRSTDGGLQFDNGICGVVMVEAYEAFREKRYLDAAIRAGEWALQQPMVLNWNYNSFSVMLLVALYGATGETKWLDGALKKTLYGFLPGQMAQTGGWYDKHNARLVYHVIMVDVLARLLHVLPTGHTERARILGSLRLGMERFTKEVLSVGVLAAEDGMSLLRKALVINELSGEREVMQQAFYALVNAHYDRAKKSVDQLALWNYLAWQQNQP